MKTRLLILMSLAMIACGVLFSQDKIEEKLADAVIKANRQVKHDQEKTQADNAKAQQRGMELELHCRTRNQVAGLRQQDGLWGCVVAAAPPGTNR
jgi:hypothetical protein